MNANREIINYAGNWDTLRPRLLAVTAGAEILVQIADRRAHAPDALEHQINTDPDLKLLGIKASYQAAHGGRTPIVAEIIVTRGGGLRNARVDIPE